jgi:hypothetical protein
MTDCDTCGCTVSTTGYLGGGISCKTCVRARNEGDTETIRERVAKYGGGDNWTGDVYDIMYDWVDND